MLQWLDFPRAAHGGKKKKKSLSYLCDRYLSYLSIQIYFISPCFPSFRNIFDIRRTFVLGLKRHYNIGPRRLSFFINEKNFCKNGWKQAAWTFIW